MASNTARAKGYETLVGIQGVVLWRYGGRHAHMGEGTGVTRCVVPCMVFNKTGLSLFNRQVGIYRGTGHKEKNWHWMV